MREAFRVLKKGGVLGIVDFGRRENMWVLSVLEEIMEDPPKRPHGNLREKVHKEKVQQMCRDAGFSVVKGKYFHSLLPEQPDEDKLLEQIAFVAQANLFLKGLDEEARNKLMRQALALYNERYGPQTEEFPFVETTHFYAKK